jgi:hypothetical protein
MDVTWCLSSLPGRVRPLFAFYFTYVLTIIGLDQGKRKKKKEKGSDERIHKYAVNQSIQLMAAPKMALMARGTVRLLEAPV